MTNARSPVFVPASCTDSPQPLDLSVNKVFKDLLKSEFQKWYADKVCASLTEESGDPTFDMKLSYLKPIHAKWLVSAVQELSRHNDKLCSGFREAGILSCFT